MEKSDEGNGSKKKEERTGKKLGWFSGRREEREKEIMGREKREKEDNGKKREKEKEDKERKKMRKKDDKERKRR